MQEQNFEKQVRDKMNELSFVPSAPVWEKVEKQIRKKKEKRRIIFWLLPILLTSGLGWWIWQSKNTSLTDQITQTPIQKETIGKNGPIPGEKKSAEEYIVTDEKHKTQKDLTNTSGNKSIYHANKNYKPGKILTTKNRGSKALKKDEDYVSLKVAPSQTEVNKKDKYPAFNSIIIGFNADSILQSKSLAIIEIPTLVNEPKQNQKPTVKNKWQLAITAQGGISGISDGFGSFANSADIAFDNLSPSSSLGGGFGNAPSPPPSAPKASFSFSTGVDVKRKISNRLAVFTGLRYAYYSNTLKVGSTVYRDTSFARQDASFLRTAAYYRNDANYHSYTNKYHYIQLPLGIEYKLAKAFPLNLQAGIIVDQLLSANALFYNYHAGVYINDKDMLAKTGIQLFSGFNYHFRSRKAFSFAVGPQLQYGLNNLSKNKDNNQHLYFAGISTQVFFKNK